MLTVRVAVDIMVPLHAVVELSKPTMRGLSMVCETDPISAQLTMMDSATMTRTDRQKEERSAVTGWRDAATRLTHDENRDEAPYSANHDPEPVRICLD